MSSIVAIDPGVTGALAWLNKDNELVVMDMPETTTELFDKIVDLRFMDNIDLCVIEKTGTYVPGNSGPASVKFARHCGALDIIPYAAGIRSEYIAPSKWMKHFNPPKDKKQRKDHLWELSCKHFPNTKIKKSQGDAVALLIYSLQM